MSQKYIQPLLESGALKGDKNIVRLMNSEYGAALLHSYSYMTTEYFSKTNHFHGQIHMERVALLGALIAMTEGFSAEDTGLALFSCIYHDIGRDSFHIRETHGLHSAQMVLEKGLLKAVGVSDTPRVACVQAAIATHAMDDRMLYEMEDLFGVPENEAERCRRICFCLKDADNLDRVRIGDLNTAFLRFPCSPGLVDTAQYLYRTTKQFDPRG